MILASIDPDNHGGFALWEDGAPVSVWPIPLVVTAQGRDRLDVRTLAAWMEKADHVVAERAAPMPGMMRSKKTAPDVPAEMEITGGTIANYNRGYGCGAIEGVCHALVIPYTLVAPQRWQNVMLKGIDGKDTKQRSIVAAQRLYPSVSLLPTPRSRKPSNGFSDALLIGGWYLRCLADRLNFGLT